MINQGRAGSKPAQYRLPLAYARGIWLGVAALLVHFSLGAAALMAADGVFWRRVAPPLKLVIYVAAILAVGSIEIAITHYTGKVQPVIERTALVGLGAICIAALIGSDRAVDQRRLLLTFAFTILAANLLTWLLGIQGQGVYLEGTPKAEMLKGISRVQFFFSYGVNSYGTTAGMFLALGLTDAIKTRSWLSYAVTAMAIISALLTDSRGALVSAALTVLVVSVRGRALPRAVVLGSFFALPTILLLGPLLNSLFAFAIRTGGMDLTTGRAPYWLSIISRLPDNVDSWWLGLGLTGSTRLNIPLSNLSQLSVYLRQSDVLPHAHNLWLQIFLEGGILKLLVVLSLFLAIVDAASRIQETNIRRLVLCTLYIPIAGVTESTFDYMRIENLIILFVLAGLAFTRTERVKGPKMNSNTVKPIRDLQSC